eukprot:2435082-Pyramimonas_sp.AAC.1
MQAGESLSEGQEKANDVLPQPDVQSGHHAGVPGHRADGAEAGRAPTSFLERKLQAVLEAMEG